MDSNLSLYHIFFMVAKTGNISKAASELYISQPAISKAIQKLEQNLNVSLFHRNSRGVSLTDEGKLIYQQVAVAFDALEKGEQDLKRVQELGIGYLRIGVSTTLCKYLLLSYLKEFVERYPHVKITISCQSTFETMELLQKQKIDIGLIGKPQHLTNIDFYPIKKIQDTFVATKTYIENLKLRQKTEDFNVFSHGNIMLLNEENITRRYVEQYFSMQKIEINQVLEVSNMDLLIDFAKIGIGVSCVIKEFIEKELENGELVEIPLDVKIPTREVGFAHLKNAIETESMKKFIEFYKSYSMTG